MELIGHRDWRWRQGLRPRMTAVSSTCSAMQSFTVAVQGERYNLVPGSAPTAAQPGEHDGRTVPWYTAIGATA